MPTEHSIRSLPGGIFWSSVVAFVLYAIGFITSAWEKGKWGIYDRSIGLWSAYQVVPLTYADYDWFKATRAFITIGLILLIVCLALIFVFMFVTTTSVDRNTLMKIFAGVALAAVACMLVGFIIFGVKHENVLYWSYGLSVVGGGFCLAAAILSIIHLRRGGYSSLE